MMFRQIFIFMSEQLFLPAPKTRDRSSVRRSRLMSGLGVLAVLIATVSLIFGSQQKEWLANLTINDLQLSSSTDLLVLQEAQNVVLEKNLTPIEVIVNHQDERNSLVINTSLQEIGFVYSLDEEFFDQDDLERITPFFSDNRAIHGSSPEVAQLEVDANKWKSFISGLETEVERDAEKPSLYWSEGQWHLNNGISGRSLDADNADRALGRLSMALQRGATPQKVSLQTRSVLPVVSGEEADEYQAQYEKIQAYVSQPIVLHLRDEIFRFDLNSEEDFILIEDGEVLINREKLILALDSIRESFYRETNTIRITGKEEVRYNAFQALTEGEFVEGRRVNAYELADQIIAELVKEKVPEEELDEETDESLSEMHVYGQVYEIPLKVYSEIDEMEYDLISVGYSEYSHGNAMNRVHNIQTGLDRINGTIIAPGEKISFNRMNGPINSEFRTGYAIFGSTSKPSLGGGICQVSTTFYRSLLNAGTPITMRQNHSWDLSYYRAGGYGLDATIFPSVGLDVKGVNDYGSHLFFYSYTRPETEEAFVLMYGKADGRSVILEPEEEYEAFYGAKTLKWTQTIEKADGEVIMNDIVSRYRQ
jgi:vancomycin resistance protein YoaR